MLESSQFDPRVSGWLREQAWPLDGTQESIDLIATILHAADADGFGDEAKKERQKRIGVEMEFLRVLSSLAWYRDGLDQTEKLRVIVLLGVAATEDGRSTTSMSADFRWVEFARRTLESELFDSVQTADGRQIVIAGLHSGEYESYVRHAIDLVKKYYASVEGFAGPIEEPGLVVAVDEFLKFCGLASGASVATILHPVCVTDGTVVHELIHLAAPPTYEIWFNEGIAYVGAGLIAERQAPRDDPCAEFDTGVCADNLSFSEEEKDYSDEASQGTDFISDYVKLAGKDALSNVIKRLSSAGFGVGFEIITMLRDEAPPEAKAEVNRLIAEFRLNPP